MPTLQDDIWERDLTPYIHISLLGQDTTADVLSEDQLYPHKRVYYGNHVRLCGVSVFHLKSESLKE